MKLIINISNLKIGGGIQVASSLLSEFKSFHENEYHVILAYNLAGQVNANKFPENFHFYMINHSPVHIPKRYGTLKQLKSIEEEVKPDIVFSIFGPSYWQPKAPHLIGFGLGYFLYPDSPFWTIINLKDDLYIKLLKIVKMWQIKKNANYFHIETLDAKLRLHKYFNIPLENILVASNTYHYLFNSNSGNYIFPIKQKNEFRLVSISAYYPHKNLEIINEVIQELNKQQEFNFKFILTLPKTIFRKKFINSPNIVNLGPVKIEDCPSIYTQSDVLFHPTLLEIFSASYLEAMKMGLPILTSNLPFALDICGNAAEYFDPLDPHKIAESIIKVARNKTYYNSLKENGFTRLKDFDTSKQRAEKIINFCSKIISKNVQK
jgi:glycosyltransferase involved in cell wall biosynthesis